MNKVEYFLRELASARQILMIYELQHPKVKQAVDGVYNKLSDLLSGKNEIIVGIIGGELSCGRDIFFDLSNHLKDFINDLTDKKVERMVFRQGISWDELKIFLNALIKKREGIGNFIDYFSHLKLDNISLGKVGIIDKEQATVKRAANESIDYNEILGVVGVLFKNILRGNPINPPHMKMVMETIFKEISVGNWDILRLAAIKRYDLVTFLHSLSVGILAMFFASKLKFKKDDILELGIAGLFHDMGKIAISQKVINKPTILTTEEMNYVKSHTVLGAEILLQYVDSLGILPVMIAFEHHLHYDLKGYPRLAYSRKPHLLSLMVTLCDCYDALCQRRSYKRAYSPEIIYNIMLKGRGKLFEPKLFDKFFGFLGCYPIGTIIELNSGAIGVVRAQNEDSIFSPKVEIISDSDDKGKIIDLDKLEAVSIKKSMNPLAEGKRYISFI